MQVEMLKLAKISYAVLSPSLPFFASILKGRYITALSHIGYSGKKEEEERS
jgi:hypothetical protein